MTSSTFIMKKERLMLLCNTLTDMGYERNIKFAAPMMNNLPLFKAGFDESTAEISDLVSRKTYADVYNPMMRQVKNAVKNEVPVYEDIRSALFQSGIVPISGVERLEALIEKVQKQQMTRGGDVYYLALDTNLLRDRFFSTYLCHLPDHPHLDFVLCETVREEMKNRKDKFKRYALQQMKPLPAKLMSECFLNQNCLFDRKRYVGFLEYNRMRSATACEEIDAKSTRSGTLNDQIIIESYSDFVKVSRKVIFMSRDNEIIRMMSGEDNVIPVLMECGPVSAYDFDVSWISFFDFVYLLGLLFGRLDIMVGGVRTASVSSVWRGKDAREWEKDDILLKLHQPQSGDKEEMREFRQMHSSIEHYLRILEGGTVVY